MGLMDMLQETGNNLLSSLTPTKKPGALCVQSCSINDARCENCLAEQQKIFDELEELKQLETAIDNIKNKQSVTPPRNKCSLCGAPIENGEKACPYCDTPYSSDMLAFDIPASEIEQDNLLLQKASDIYAVYANIKKRAMENKGNDLKGKLPSFLDGAISTALTATGNFADMSAQEIRQFARENNVGYREYITGVMLGAYKSAGDIKIQAINQGIKDMNEARKKEAERYFAENRRIEAERQARLQKTNQERNAIQNRMAASRSYGYNGGADRTCYDCTYYSAGAQSCALNGRSTNAGDYCGCWKLK